MSYPENWEKDIPHLPLQEIDFIPRTLKIGNKYHLTWAKGSCVWILEQVVGNTAYLITPKSKKRLTSDINTLRCTNKEANQNAKLRVKFTK